MGLREGEIAGLEREHCVDWKTRTLHVKWQTLRKPTGSAGPLDGYRRPLKGNSPVRVLPIPPLMFEILRQCYRAQRERYMARGKAFGVADWFGDHERRPRHVVCDPQTGGPVRPDAIYRDFQFWRERAGLRPMTQHHGGRATVSNLLDAEGVPARSVALWLGHSDGDRRSRTAQKHYMRAVMTHRATVAKAWQQVFVRNCEDYGVRAA